MKPIYFERSWPYALAVIGAFLWWVYGSSYFPAAPEALLSATGTFSSVLIGFLITAKAIVLGLTGSAVFKKLVETGYHKVLFDYLYESLWSATMLLTVSIVGFFVPVRPPAGASAVAGMPLWYQVIWVLSALAALFLFIRISRHLFTMLRQV